MLPHDPRPESGDPTDDPPGDLPGRVRRACASVADRATLVRIDVDALAALAERLVATRPVHLPEERFPGDDDAVVTSVVAWNAVNFGSGWFPHVDKEPGMGGARTMATRWHRRCTTEGPPTASWLSSVGVDQVAAVFGQPTTGPAGELVACFAAAWRELGDHLLDHHDGSASAMVAAAAGSAAALADELVRLPHWADVHRHGPVEVPLGKRAQILPWQLSSAVAGPLGRFHDLDGLTMFADNLVPHVLRHHGVLVVDDGLAGRIEREEVLASGEVAEVELRAVAVHATELLVAELRGLGRDDATAASIDEVLWQAGQDPTVKARPRHRCRCTFY